MDRVDVVKIVCAILIFGGGLGLVVGVAFWSEGTGPITCGDSEMPREGYICLNGGGSYEEMERIQRDNNELSGPTIALSAVAILIGIPLAIWVVRTEREEERQLWASRWKGRTGPRPRRQ